jgi:hypothetical protein
MGYHSNIMEERQPRQYRIICLIHRADGHLKALGYSENDSGVMYDGTWTIAEARQALFQGHRLYIVSLSTGDEADLEFADGHIRAKPDQATDASLQNLPDCSQR